MIWDGAILSDMGMVTSTGSVSGQSQINIIDASHPMADGHSNGNVTIAATGTKVRWGFPTASADSIAEVAGQPNKSAIFAYQTGDSMNGLNAPHRRVGFFIDSTTPVDLNANGWGLFDAGVEWAINGGSSTYMPDPNQATATVGAFKGNVAGKRGASAKIQAISGSIQRISLSFAGGPVAVHVSGDPDSANNGLFHIYTDHLGSSGSLSDSSGAYIPNSHAKYTPFGDWRTEPTATAGDRYYTNHKHNNLGNGGADDLGLIYMNARYYLPGVGRFASADTIVPNAANPQSYNRYSYVLNNPISRYDPSGHFCYDAESNEFSDGDCFSDEQYELVTNFVRQLKAGVMTDLELAEWIINRSMELIDNPVAALRAVAEIVRHNTGKGTSIFGWHYSDSKYHFSKWIKDSDKSNPNLRFDDSGFGDLADPHGANQITHFIGIAYIAGYREAGGESRQGSINFVSLNEMKNFRQDQKTNIIENDLGEIAVDMGIALVTEMSDIISSNDVVDRALTTISNYEYRVPSQYQLPSNHPWADAYR